MDSVKIWILLLVSLSAVSAGVLIQEDDIATPDGQMHEVARSDPGCSWQEINSTTADGETTTVFMDFTAGDMLFLNGSACEVRKMNDKEMAMQEYCHGQELQSDSEDEGEEQSEMDAEDFEEDDNITVDLETLPVRMQGYCRGKVIHPMVPVASGEGLREKRWFTCRLRYRCRSYRRCYRVRRGWWYITICYYYRSCYLVFSC